MISFYPGPSRIHDQIPAYVKDAFREGILSANHRSEAFVALAQKTISLMRKKLGVPEDYTVFFTSSATECWEIIAQSIPAEKSYHVYNGAFGQKWFEYTQKIRPAEGIQFGAEEKIKPSALAGIGDNCILCITQNETSNGTQIDASTLRSIRKNHTGAIIAVDAVSSMGGISLDFKMADIWLASVQKCFGLPAGLGLLICSPRSLDAVQKLGERKYYNSLTFMTEMMAKWQTSYTPNVLGIYLLMRVLDDTPVIHKVHEKVTKRHAEWIKFLSNRTTIAPLITHKALQSYTVIPVAAKPDVIEKIKFDARKKGLLLGEGYGVWKPETFRIANFPALKKKEIQALMKVLEKF